MATLDVLNLSGEKVDEIELADEVFCTPVKEHLLHEVVVAQLAAKRQGTVSTKGRSEIRGSKKKIYRQKGTGRARHGSTKAPIFVGGGTCFGPKPRSYEQRTPKKVWKGALRSALSLRVSENKLKIIQDLKLGEYKTKRVAQLLDALGVRKGLFLDEKGNMELICSVRNLAQSQYLAPEGLNVYDVLRYDSLIMTPAVAKQIEERLKS